MNGLATPPTYRLTRPGGLGFFRRRSAGQFALCCLGVLLLLLALVVSSAGSIGRALFGVVGLGLCVLAATRLPGGEDLLALVGPGARFVTRRASRRSDWAAALRPALDLRLPLLFAGIRLYELDRQLLDEKTTRRRKVGFVLDEADGSVSLVVRVHGAGFLLADPNEQAARLSAFGDALAGVARDDSPVCRVTWSQFVGPAPLSGHLSYLAETRRADPDPVLAAAYGELVRDTAATAVSVEVLVTISVALSRVQAARGDDRLRAGAERLLEEHDLFVASLVRAGLVPIGPLPLGALVGSLRTRLDPSSARAESDLSTLQEAIDAAMLERGFPLSIEERRRSILVDGRAHRLFRVAEWPRREVRADFLASFLCEQDATRALTVQFEPVPRHLARRQALAAATRVGASIEERELKGRRVGAEEARARLAAEALDVELEAGAALEIVAGLVDLSATDEVGLDLASERVTQAGASAGLELRVLSLRQGEALVASLPLGRAIGGRAR